MDQQDYKISAVVRKNVGKGHSRLLRRNGSIPATVYGNKSEPKSIALPVKEISRRLHSKRFTTTVLTLDVENELISVLPKDYQLDPVTDNLMHVDFLRIYKDSNVSVQIPVRFINENKSIGIKQGGILNVICHEISLLCPANKIPDSISVDIGGLKIGDSIHLKDLSFPEGISPVSNCNITIATIVANTSDL
ncbi:50S ribosomal protein L25/general stress protein Ctc [Candidatus Liberibacter americanus]|uniref:Large ribosomal subunit protein bL25 n=1 Tax=Candidatus Liberibacter americanus str. Sao Paulo TaxID=1261131 RepID=U6B2Z0_9HYPH|nr:50S ribosomal protein L25/general stress protein Ctc [Candidatus Liberibacter americanus]AHA27429.1 Ribosomal protein L25 [Candidatus Liberibacter americanus str. Sao Paulo]EMS36702.1 50S ribosomal protein L25/general stress protein Ctc [Candidatus Liberibacter americanus PW_SP]